MKLLKVDSIESVEKKFADYFSNMDKKKEKINLIHVVGRYLGEDIFADMDSPSFRRSVVDGYAVKAADTFGISESIPVFLESIGTIVMGKPTDLEIKSGQTAYVPTGGMIPEGADAMVMVEHVDILGEDMISINKAVAPNANIMNVGDDFREGELFFKKGHRVTPKDVGLLASCGKGEILVYQKPKLSVISTGDELVEPETRPGPCHVRDINSYAISAYAESLGAEVVDISLVHDEAAAFRDAILRAMEEADIVILSGGSSAGNMDFTADVIESLGEPGVVTHGIAIRPGKPTVIGIFTDREEIKAVIGLPGHPLSSIMVFDVIVGAFIRKYYLGNQDGKTSVYANISENIHAGEGRTTYQLVNLRMSENDGERKTKVWIADPIRGKSGAIAQLAKAHGYVTIPMGDEGLKAGEMTEVTLI